MVGIVNTGLDHDTHHYSSNNAWCLFATNGSLYGNGKEDYDAQGKLNVGDRVGVLVDLDGGEGGYGGSVRFFVNGSEYGPGFKSGVTGRSAWSGAHVQRSSCDFIARCAKASWLVDC